MRIIWTKQKACLGCLIFLDSHLFCFVRTSILYLTALLRSIATVSGSVFGSYLSGLAVRQMLYYSLCQEGDGEPVDNRWRGDRMKRQNFEDLEDELAWDNTPIEAALRATQSPKPSTSSSSLDCSSGGKSGQDVYAVVEQKNKKRDKMNKEKELPDGWEIVNDNDRTYYWHVPTGATQWERPSAETTQGMAQQDTEDQPPPVPVRNVDLYLGGYCLLKMSIPQIGGWCSLEYTDPLVLQVFFPGISCI